MSRRPIQVAHHLPRRRHHTFRTRLKVPRDAVEKIARHIHSYPEVTYVETNQTTGSILIHHQNDLHDLIAKLEAEGICELTGLPEDASDVLASLGPRVLTLVLIAVIFGVPRWYAS